MAQRFFKKVQNKHKRQTFIVISFIFFIEIFILKAQYKSEIKVNTNVYLFKQ